MRIDETFSNNFLPIQNREEEREEKKTEEKKINNIAVQLLDKEHFKESSKEEAKVEFEFEVSAITKIIERVKLISPLCKKQKINRAEFEVIKSLLGADSSGLEEDKAVKALENIQKGSRVSLLQSVEELLKDRTFKSGVADVLRAMGDLSTGRREEITEIVMPIVPIINSGYSLAKIIKLLTEGKGKCFVSRLVNSFDCKWRQRERLEKISFIRTLIIISNKSLATRDCLDQILELIMRMEKQGRKNVVELIVPLVSSLNSLKEVLLIFGALVKVREKADIIRIVKEMLESWNLGEKVLFFWQVISVQSMSGLLRFYGLGNIFTLIDKANASEQAGIIKVAKPFIKQSTVQCCVNGIESFIETIIKIKLEDRESVVEAAEPLIRDGMPILDIGTILEVVNDIKKENRKGVIEDAKPLIQEEIKGWGIMRILQVINGIKKEDRAGVIEDAEPLIREDTSGIIIGNILEAMNEIKKEDRKGVIEDVELLIWKGMNRSCLGVFLKAVNRIKKEGRVGVIEAARPVIRLDIENYFIGLILEVIEKIEIEDREAVIEAAKPMIKEGMNNTHAILGFIGKIKKEDRAGVIEGAKPLIKEDPNGYDIGLLLSIIDKLEDEDRERVIGTVVGLFKEGKVVTLSKRNQVLLCFLCLPKELHKQVLEYLNASSEEELNITAMLRSDEKLRLVCYEYLQKRLESETNATTVRFLSNLILDGEDEDDEIEEGNKFLLFSDHPLFQCAINHIIHSNPKMLKDPANPYVVFHKLQNLQGEDSEVKIKIEQETVLDEVVSLNRAGFVDMAQKLRVKVLGKHLPNVTWKDFKQVINNLEDRVKALPSEESEESEKFEQEVESAYGTTFDVLINNFLEDLYLKRLIEDKLSNSEAFINKKVVQFFSIVKYILDQSNIPVKGEFLSLQGHILLSMSSSIQGCSKGKSEGIQLAYNQLPNEYKIDKQVKKETTEQVEVEAFIGEFIEKEIENMISIHESPFLNDSTVIGNFNSLRQLSHQSIYLRNLIGNLVGLNNSMQFDISTNCVDSALIQADRAEILGKFYEYFTVSLLVEKLQQVINAKFLEVDSKGNTSHIFLNHLKTFIQQANIYFDKSVLCNQQSKVEDPVFLDLFLSGEDSVMQPIALGKDGVTFGKDGQFASEEKEGEGKLDCGEDELREKYEDKVCFINQNNKATITKKGSLILLSALKYTTIKGINFG